jgi:hypothetical protein
MRASREQGLARVTESTCAFASKDYRLSVIVSPVSVLRGPASYSPMILTFFPAKFGGIRTEHRNGIGGQS